MGEKTTNLGSRESGKLGKAIQQARQAASITQQELCHRAGLSYSTLAKIERGAIKAPSVFTVYQISQVLGVEMDGLLSSVTGGKDLKARMKRTSKSGISFVYFDINGCLVRLFHPAFTQIARDTDIPPERIESAFLHLNDSVCRGDISMNKFNSEFAKRLGLDSIDWSRYYVNAVEPVGEMHELIKWASQNYKVGLISNIMPDQIKLLIKHGSLPDIDYDAIVDSSEVKAIKPESKIYKIAEQKANVPTSEILYIDDSRTNLMAAERRGWNVLWFDYFRPQESVERIRSSLKF